MIIGNVTLKNNIFLAPLAGVSDRPFRVLCAEEGAGLVYTEMVSAKAIAFNNKKTFELLRISPELETAGVQLFGSEPEVMAEGAAKIDNEAITLFDINMGCPVPKVVNNGEGSALMKDPDLIGRIVEAMVKAVDKPVTVKIRAGFDKGHINAVEVAKVAEAAGASAVGVHGRTREQYYAGKANWSVIRDVKEAVRIPVLGNGDVFTAEDAKRMLDTTGCDGILVARGAQGNPWIFREILHYLETGELLQRPTTNEILEMIYRHRDGLVRDKGDYIALRELRKHVAWYTKGLKNATKLRQEINRLEEMASFDELVTKILVGNK